MPTNTLSVSGIKAHFTSISHALVSDLEVFPQIDSTNSHLMRRAQNSASSGCMCVADHQTDGKGRRGRKWVSPKGRNIYGSFLWKFHDATRLNGLSLAVGVGVIRVLKNHGISNVSLKWPNDIYCEGKKLGGILVEVTTHSNGSASAIIGVGLNLHLPPEVAHDITQPYTDLHTISPHTKFKKNKIVAELANEILPIAAMFEKQSLSAYLEEWREHDCLLGKEVTLFSESKEIKGLVQGIDEQGLLKVQLTCGLVQTFSSGEVSLSA